MAAAEIEARQAEAGLWRSKSPVAPWDYRNPSEPAADVAVDGATVFVTKSGERYHRGTCKHVSKSKIPISLEEARERYSACKTCKPPK